MGIKRWQIHDFPFEITERDGKSYGISSWQKFNDGPDNLETSNDRKTASFQDLFEIYNQLAAWIKNPRARQYNNLMKSVNRRLLKP